jgi:hypothetical protein
MLLGGISSVLDFELDARHDLPKGRLLESTGVEVVLQIIHGQRVQRVLQSVETVVDVRGDRGQHMWCSVRCVWGVKGMVSSVECHWGIGVKSRDPGTSCIYIPVPSSYSLSQKVAALNADFEIVIKPSGRCGCKM